MSKPLFGLVLGGILGVFDGLTAWFTPSVRDQLLTIVLGSTIKGLIAGLAIGYFSKKVDNLALGVVAGLAIGLRPEAPEPARPDARRTSRGSRRASSRVWWPSPSPRPPPRRGSRRAPPGRSRRA